MSPQLYLYDCDKQIDIHITAAETIIGRDSILQCNDKRISRQHGIIKLTTEETGSIQITSTHSNPIFIRTEDSVLNILSKDLTATLRQGEKFALLPDQYWYEVRFRTGEDQETAISSSDNQVLRVRTMEEVNNAVASSDPIEGTVEKRKNCDESEAESSKKPRTEEPDTIAEAANCSSAENIPVVKSDPGAADEASSSRPRSPTAAPVKVEIKTEVPDSTGPPPRPSCEFGIRCYRHNREHRTQFAHPSDNDYRRPTFPAAPGDAPHCPFGASCYRRNPQHFREYQHPDSSEYRASVTPVVLQPPQLQQFNIGTDDNGQRQRRRRNRRFARDIVMAAIMNPSLFDGSDDDDRDGDLFDYDSESDEYRPGRESNEDEDDDEEAETEEFHEDEDEE